MYTPSFFHSPVPFRTEGERGGCCGFGVSVTLPVWTRKTLNILPKVTNNSLSFPDDFQYSVCSSTSPLWRLYIAVLLPICDNFPFFPTITSVPKDLVWRKVGILFPRINLSASLKMVDYLGLSEFTVLSPNLCWKNLEGMFLGLWKVLPSVIPVPVKLSWAHPDPLGRAGGASWHRSMGIQQGQKQNGKAVATAY